MPNRIRGEAELMAAGKSHRLLLTLGALAEIEDSLGLASLSDVGARLKQMRALDLAIVAAALLRGGGHDMTPADVLRLPLSLGDVARAVAEAFVAANAINEPAGGANDSRPFAGTVSSPSVSAN